jgi:hypothetical protein
MQSRLAESEARLRQKEQEHMTEIRVLRQRLAQLMEEDL